MSPMLTPKLRVPQKIHHSTWYVEMKHSRTLSDSAMGTTLRKGELTCSHESCDR